MKTRNTSTSSSALIRAFLTAGTTKAQSIWAILVGAFVYRCGALVVLGSALALNAAAQSKVPTAKTKIKPLVLKFPDLWIPYGIFCNWPSPTYNSTNGILAVTVGNQGSASSPKCSLRVLERRGEWDTIDGPWKDHKYYWASVPALAPKEQVLIHVQVAKFSTGSFDSNGKPIKHPRQWIFLADGKKQVPEVNEDNNHFVWKTLN